MLAHVALLCGFLAAQGCGSGASVSADGPRPVDQAAVDLGTQDAGSDVAPTPDLAPSPDVAPSPDLVPSPDLMPSPDLAPSPDVASSPDLMPSPDLVPAPDLAPAPDQGTGVSATLSYPSLFPNDRFPTSFAHLIGSPALSSPQPLVHISLANGGPAAVGASVEVELAGYSTPAAQSTLVPAGGTVTLDLSPSLDLAKLFAQTSDVPSNIRTTVRVGGTIVQQETHQVTVLSRNALFLQKVVPYSAVFVTPNDKSGAITALLAAAAQKMHTKTLVGYQSMSARPLTTNIAVGYLQQELIYLLATQQICGTLTQVIGGFDADIDLYAVDASGYQALLAGQPFTPLLYRADATSGTPFCFTAVADGWHHLVYYNTTDNFVSRNVTRTRGASHHEGTLYQAAALFDALKERGMTYVNTPGGSTWWSGIQNVKYPAETWASQTGNCIDGTLLFASAFEALGMRPVLVYVPHHAFVAVRSWSNEDMPIPVETTMVGSDTFQNAWVAASTRLATELQAQTAKLVDVDKTRPLGIAPAPM